MGEDNLTSAGMSMTEEQQSMPLRDAVFMSLRKAILTGKLKPGDRLTEVKLGKILGTSRTPIREAIRLLEADGLVTIVAGSGARVSRMTVEDLQEVMEIRSALEQLSAGLASERITEEEKEQLREACASFNRITQTGDSVMIAEDGLADNIYRYRYEFIQDDLRYEHLIAEHTEICDAIVSGRREEAEKAAKVHIDRQCRAIRKQLLSENGD